MERIFWSPWHGCHKCSPGCLNCYVYFLDATRDIDSTVVKRNKTNFNLPLKKDRQGNFKIPAGSIVATCFTSDFFLPEADEWRNEAWEIIRQRSDVKFLICTKRIERFEECLPADWGEGYENVALAVTMECQSKLEERFPMLKKAKAKKKFIFVSPILERIDFKDYLKSGEIDMVSVGGESYDHARACDFEWVKDIKRQCDESGVEFDFHQTGTIFIYNGRKYTIKHCYEHSQAKKAMKMLNEN